MLSVPFALSIHNFIHSVGADCGFAAIIGLALLVILYFAHARETTNLRDGLDEAHGRIESLELRVQQLIHQQSMARPAGPPTIAPAPVVRPMGSALASLRRAPVAAAVTHLSAVTLIPAAAYTLAAPSLGSATKLIPDPKPPAAPQAVPARFAQDTAIVAASTAAGETVVGQPLVAASAAATLPTPAPRPGGGNGSPPRVQIRANGAPAAGAAGAAAGVPRRTVPLAGSSPRGGGEGPQRSRLRRILPVILGLVIVAAAVVVLLSLTNGGTSGKTSVNHHKPTSHKKSGKHPAKFTPADWTVSVLNGTAVEGLAADVSSVLTKKGYKQGSITNAASQTQSATLVYYKKVSGKVAAEHVAAALHLGKSHVRPASPTVVQSCATSPTGAAASCGAQVIVSVGSDKADLAAAGTTTG